MTASLSLVGQSGRLMAALLFAFAVALLPASASAQPVEPPTGAKAPEADPPEVASADTTAPAGAPETASANIRLRRLEQRVQALKEQAWRIKARVGMLKEAVLGGSIGARASIAHENKMGGSFRLVKLVYALDGTQIFSRTDDSGKLHDQKRFDILSGPIAPGNHTLSVLLLYRGHGYGVFEYLKQYKFTVRSSHTVVIAEGKQTQVTVVGYERGGVTTPLEKRPAVDFKVNYATDRPAGAKGR